MSADSFDPAHVENCPSCAHHAKELEAATGLRCIDCLEEFGRRPWIHPSEQDASRCPGCQRLAVYRSTAPTSPGRYGTGRNA